MFLSDCCLDWCYLAQQCLVVTGTVDQGTVCEFPDGARLCGAGDILEGRDTIQSDFGRLKKWKDCHEVQQEQVKGLKCVSGQSQAQIEAEWRTD